jgi:dipeptidyl aminopeptidase/acylaminoacyl peptidase
LHARGDAVSFRRVGERQCEGGQSASVWYERTSAGWERQSHSASDSSEVCPDIFVDQGLNEPARIVMKDRGSDRTLTLFDLNPQFADLSFAKVEHLRWPDGKGGFLEGGLYLPVDYVPGKKYPLVIQTHGFDPKAFWVEGPHTTAFAAQPLAAHGMSVLQLNDIFYDSLVTPEELDRAMNAYEKAIEELDNRGLIDVARVGLVGFSRTGMYVKYTLTHSSKSFAAAVVADANDAGYWQYMLTEPFLPRIGAEMDTIFGAPPFGDGLQTWLAKSPGFSLDRVHTPLLIEALGPFSLLNEWEWFSGLRRLEKPVDLVYLPAGTHVLVTPWDRRVSLEATLDGLCFWLTGEEAPDARKSAQYRRWRELRQRATK